MASTRKKTPEVPVPPEALAPTPAALAPDAPTGLVVPAPPPPSAGAQDGAEDPPALPSSLGVDASTTPATPEAAPEENDTVLRAEHEALLADLEAQLAQLQQENTDLRAQVQEANEVLAATRREQLALEEERASKARALREMLGDHVRHVVGYDEGHPGQDTSLLVFWAGSSLFAWRAFPSEESLSQEEVQHTVWELQRELLSLRTGQEALTRSILGDELSEQVAQARSRPRLDTKQGPPAPPPEAPRLAPGHVRMRVKRGNVVLSMGTRSAADGAFDVPAWEVEGMDNDVVEILARG